MSSSNADSNLIAQATIAKLEGVKGFMGGALICRLAVGCINLKETVVPNIILLSVLKDDLYYESEEREANVRDTLIL